MRTDTITHIASAVELYRAQDQLDPLSGTPIDVANISLVVPALSTGSLSALPASEFSTITKMASTLNPYVSGI